MMQRWSTRMAEPLRILMRRGVLFVMAAISAVIVTLSPIATQPAAAQISDIGLGGNSCAVETVGWVLCPTMRSISRLADKGFTYINQSSLSIDYTLFNSKGKTFTAWEIMRNIANALFVIVFLFIIYSYLVGRTSGIYSLKRLLPRLLIAAIAVNLSYYVGVILIDISNIVGDSLWQIMKNIYGNGSPVLPLGVSANPSGDGNLTKMAGAVMGNTSMVWVLLPPLAAVSITVATVSAAMVILIIMREALIATLILAAPVLIVLYLLPNLERVAAQAMRLFLQLLILYPIVAVLLGAGQIVSLAAGGWDSPSAFYGGGTTSVVPDLVAAAAAVVPLLGIWFVFKNLSSVMSTAGSRLSASIKGARGGKDDKNARVTGKATAGAAGIKNATGLNNPLGRRSAFSRNRRRKSLGGSAQTGEGESGLEAGVARRTNTPFDALQSALSNGGLGQDAKRQQEDALKDGIAEADKLSAENPNEVNLESAAAEALSANLNGNNDQPDKPKTAKDIFNNLNRGHEAKDKDRKFSAGPGATGSQEAQAGSAQPTAPSTSYRAPSMAQSGNIVSGSSTSQPVQVIAVPVQVDGSALLGQNQHRPPENMTQPPISGTEEKAKARAQKYLFDADKDLKNAEDELDAALNKQDKSSEQPHTSRYEDKKKDDNE